MPLLKYLQSISLLLLRGAPALRTRFWTSLMKHISQAGERILFLQCSSKRMSKRVCLTGGAHLSRGDEGLFNEPTHSE